MPKSKRKRTHRHIDPLKKAQINLQSEINFIEKKTTKLLRLREERRLKKNQKKKVRNEDGEEAHSVDCVRYQGIIKEGERHRKLKSYLQRLKNRLKEVKGTRIPDTYKKTTL